MDIDELGDFVEAHRTRPAPTSDAVRDSAIELMGEALFSLSDKLGEFGFMAPDRHANAVAYERVVQAWDKLTAALSADRTTIEAANNCDFTRAAQAIGPCAPTTPGEAP